MAAGNIGGGGANVGSPVGSGTADRLLSTDSSGNLATDADTRFDGTNVALGGAIVAGRRLISYQESSGIGLESRGFANNQSGDIVSSTSDARSLILRMWGGTAAGTINGINAAALAHLLNFNSGNLLIGATDARTWVAVRTNVAAALGGCLKTFQADVAHDGTGTDTFYSYSIPAGTMATDGDRVEFKYVATFAANANNKTILAVYGGTTMYTSGTVAKNGGSVTVEGSVVRTGAATQRFELRVLDDASTTRFPTVSAYGTAAETLSGAVAISFQGTAGAASDIVAKVGYINFYPAGN